MSNHREKKYQLDGLANVINQVTGVGSDPDSLLSTLVGIPYLYDRTYLDRCYRLLWPARKVVDYKPQMMSRRWGQITGIDNRQLLNRAYSYISRLQRLYRDAQRMANKDGGSVIVRLIDDGQDASQPIAYHKIKNLDYSRIIDRYEISPHSPSLLSDPTDPEFYEYHIPYDDKLNKGLKFKNKRLIHKSRIIRFRGAFVSATAQRENNGWEDSLLIPFLDPMLRYLEAQGYVASSVRTFEVMIHKIQGLFDKVQEVDGEEEIRQRLQMNQRQMSALRGIAADLENEDIQIVARQFTGVGDVLDRLRDEMVAASGLSKIQLLQEHPSGLNATGESERLAEADEIEAEQNSKWRSLIEDDVRLILSFLKASPKEIEEARWEWLSLFQSSPSEICKTNLELAKADEINIRNNIYSTEEARQRYLTENTQLSIKVHATSQVNTDENTQWVYLPSNEHQIRAKIVVEQHKNGNTTGINLSPRLLLLANKITQGKGLTRDEYNKCLEFTKRFCEEYESITNKAAKDQDLSVEENTILLQGYILIV